MKATEAPSRSAERSYAKQYGLEWATQANVGILNQAEQRSPANSRAIQKDMVARIYPKAGKETDECIGELQPCEMVGGYGQAKGSRGDSS